MWACAFNCHQFRSNWNAENRKTHLYIYVSGENGRDAGKKRKVSQCTVGVMVITRVTGEVRDLEDKVGVRHNEVGVDDHTNVP
jgi:hypothetical protein